MTDEPAAKEQGPLFTNEQAKILIENASSIRSTLMTKLFDPRRDIDEECGYDKEISIAQYTKLYEREGVAQRVVAIMPTDSWAMDPEIQDNEESDETEFEKAWKELQKEMNLYHYLHRVDELSGIGRFGVLLLGLSDGENLSKPAPGINEKGEIVPQEGEGLKLIFIRAFDESLVEVKTRETDVTNPRYNQPTMYQINFSDDVDITEGQKAGITGDTSTAHENTTAKLVHWSRIIHVADNRKTSEVFGAPRMEKVYNRLLDIRKVLSGSGEMFWKGAFPGYSFEVTPEAAGEGVTIDKTSIRKELEAYSNGLQRYLALTGVTAKSLAPQVSSPKEHLDAQFRYIAIAIGVPLRIFLGSEEAKLASSQDVKTWNKRIKRRQDKYITPLLIRPFIDRLIAFTILPVPEEEEYDVTWPDLSTPTDMDRAEVAAKITEALAKYVGGAVDQLIPPEQYLKMIMGMDAEEIKVIMEEAEKLIEAEEADAKLAEEEALAAAVAAGVPQMTDTIGNPIPPPPPVRKRVPSGSVRGV